jgi:hypothetical protein
MARSTALSSRRTQPSDPAALRKSSSPHPMSWGITAMRGASSNLLRDPKGMMDWKLIEAEGATNQLVYHCKSRFEG